MAAFLLYRELVSWYRLLDPPAEHAEEAASFRDAFERVISPPPETLLELGAGAGHNALHMKEGLRCTLTDVSKEMLALSREINPECEHVEGDMRTIRLHREFDAVLVHDAICYMLTEDDLQKVARTAFQHTRLGGAAIFAPDCTRETFQEGTELISNEEGSRALRCVLWSWDPDPSDTSYRTECGFLLRDGQEVRHVLDRHVEGVFPRAAWTRILEEVGYEVQAMQRPIGDGEVDEIFLCRRPHLAS